MLPYTNEIFDLINQNCKVGQYYNPRHTFIYFRKLKDPIVGQCGFGWEKYTIQIDVKSWNSYGTAAKFELLTHEIAHCALDMDHSKDPYNYMYESMSYLTKDQIREQFIKDLKEHCNKKVLIYE